MLAGMDDPLWAIVLRVEHPWKLGEALATTVPSSGAALPSLSLHEVYSAAWEGDLGAAIELLRDNGGTIAPEVRVLLWAGLALHVRLNDAGGLFRSCLAHCRSADELRSGSGLRVLAGLLEGHWNAARRGPGNQHERLGDHLSSNRLVDHHQVLQLALRGLASPLLRERALLARIAPGDVAWAERIRFYDAVEGGRVVEAAALAGRAALHHAQPEGPLIRAYTALTWLQQAVLGRHLPDPARALDGPSAPWRHIGDVHLEASVRAAFVSVIGRREDLAAVAAVPVTDEQLMTPSCHFAVIPIRVALAQGLPERAAELLSRRRAAGVATYLDRTLELRRLLQQNEQAAACTVATALARDMEAYDCRGRVEFELRAAGELELVDLLLLSTPSVPLVSENGPRLTTPEVTGLIGTSPEIVRIRAAAERFAPVDLPVLIRGPSGTGKDLVARALHAAAPRRTQPFIAVNCAALAEGLLESELFGHAKGAFSGAGVARHGLVAAAGEGTLFLDEIGEISRHFQAALLRLLETGEYRPVGADAVRRSRCRIVAATNADLVRQVADGLFREDLYHRLCRLEITLPPLSEHLDDLPLLVPHLVQLARGGRPADIDPELYHDLRARAWPGNVRELRNRLESMVVLHPHLTRYGRTEFHASDSGGANSGGASGGDHRRAAQTTRHGVSFQAALTGPHGVEQAAPEAGKVQRITALIVLLRQRGRLTRVEVAQELQISAMTATAYLRELCQRGIARKVMPNSAPRSHYFVSAAV